MEFDLTFDSAPFSTDGFDGTLPTSALALSPTHKTDAFHDVNQHQHHASHISSSLVTQTMSPALHEAGGKADTGLPLGLRSFSLSRSHLFSPISIGPSSRTSPSLATPTATAAVLGLASPSSVAPALTDMRRKEWHSATSPSLSSAGREGGVGLPAIATSPALSSTALAKLDESFPLNNTAYTFEKFDGEAADPRAFLNKIALQKDQAAQRQTQIKKLQGEIDEVKFKVHSAKDLVEQKRLTLLDLEAEAAGAKAKLRKLAKTRDELKGTHRKLSERLNELEEKLRLAPEETVGSAQRAASQLGRRNKSSSDVLVASSSDAMVQSSSSARSLFRALELSVFFNPLTPANILQLMIDTSHPLTRGKTRKNKPLPSIETINALSIVKGDFCAADDEKGMQAREGERTQSGFEKVVDEVVVVLLAGTHEGIDSDQPCDDAQPPMLPLSLLENFPPLLDNNYSDLLTSNKLNTNNGDANKPKDALACYKDLSSRTRTMPIRQAIATLDTFVQQCQEAIGEIKKKSTKRRKKSHGQLKGLTDAGRSEKENADDATKRDATGDRASKEAIIRRALSCLG